MKIKERLTMPKHVLQQIVNISLTRIINSNRILEKKSRVIRMKQTEQRLSTQILMIFLEALLTMFHLEHARLEDSI